MNLPVCRWSKRESRHTIFRHNIYRCKSFSFTDTYRLQFRNTSPDRLIVSEEISKLNDADDANCVAITRSAMTAPLTLEAYLVPATSINIAVIARHVDFHGNSTCVPAMVIFRQVTAGPNGNYTESARVCTGQPGSFGPQHVMNCDCAPGYCNTMTIFINHGSFMADVGYVCAVDVLDWWELDSMASLPWLDHSRLSTCFLLEGVVVLVSIYVIHVYVLYIYKQWRPRTGYLSETNQFLAKSRSFITSISVAKSFSKSAQNTAVISPCSMWNFKRFGNNTRREII